MHRRPSSSLAAGRRFPFLFGGTFIEGGFTVPSRPGGFEFPFLFGGTFIEGSWHLHGRKRPDRDFPSFSEGLSLRVRGIFTVGNVQIAISLPFRRDFH